jgi:hypothetical protein
MYAQIYAIMLITWPIEIDSWRMYTSTKPKMVVEAIKLFSAFMISALLMLKKDVRLALSNRYRGFGSFESE